MTTPQPDKAKPGDAGKAGERAKRRYEKPSLTDYGHVSKLTLTGGITTRDIGSMKQQCL